MANGFFYNGTTSTIETTGSLNAAAFGVTGSLLGTASGNFSSASVVGSTITFFNGYGTSMATATVAGGGGSGSTDVSTYLSSSWTGSTTSQFAGTASYVATASYIPTLQDVTTRGNQTSASVFITGSMTNGTNNLATGFFSHAEGSNTTAGGANSHAEGASTKALNSSAHAEGASTTSIGEFSHAEGESTFTSGQASHVEGYLTTGVGWASHAEGRETVALGNFSHAEGLATTTKTFYSHAGGGYNIASGLYQTVFGMYNQEVGGTGTFIIGNGTSAGARSNLIYASGSTLQITGSLITNGNTLNFIPGPNITITSGSAGYVISASGGGGSTDVSTYLSSSWTGSVYTVNSASWSSSISNLNTSMSLATASIASATASIATLTLNVADLYTGSVKTLQDVTTAGNQTTTGIGITGSLQVDGTTQFTGSVYALSSSIFSRELGIWNQSAVQVNLQTSPNLDLVQNGIRYTDINFVGIDYATAGGGNVIDGNKTIDIYNVDLNIPTKFKLDFYNFNTGADVYISFNVYNDNGTALGLLNNILSPGAPGAVPTNPQNASGYIKAVTIVPTTDVTPGLVLRGVGSATPYTLEVEIGGGFMHCKLYSYF